MFVHIIVLNSNEEEREKALEAINGQVWKNRRIHAKVSFKD